MNVCVGDIIKLENNQFVAVRNGRSSRPAARFPFFGRKDEALLARCCLLTTFGRKLF